MFKSKLCTKCKTGAESYMLDKYSPACPYLAYYKNRKCPFFVPIDKQFKRQINRACGKFEK